MAQKLLIVEENTAPDIQMTLNRDGSPINLTTVSAIDLYITLNGVVTNPVTACSVVDPLLGTIVYTPGANDFTDPGSYNAEVVITYGDGTVETIYEKFKIQARTKLRS
jgi:hypothetical protein